MIKINEKQQMNYSFKAVTKNHNYSEFKNKNNVNDIFNHTIYEYCIIIDDKNNDLNELYRTITKFFNANKDKKFNIDLNSFLINDQFNDEMIAILIDAIQYGLSTPWTMKSKNNNDDSECNILIDEKYQDIVNEYLTIAEDKTFVRKLQDMPSNLMTPADFENEIKLYFSNLKNVEINVLNYEDIKSKEMNLMLAVDSGSINANFKTRLITIKYTGNTNSDELAAFVGKGVCFDTGGTNIKTGNYMRWMKYDMSGAAIVSGLLHSIAKNQIKTNVVAVCPLVMNLCGNNSYRPDDVLKSYNGLTVEIDNTDAEGRLILADALWYAVKDLNATKLYDIATLTGAMIYALGDTYTGVWTNCEDMWNNIDKASKKSGELVWRLPFHHDFKDLLKSNFADICNSVSDPRGGSSRAAMFLKEFTNNLPYAHFDVAGTADKGNVGTGIMLHTFYNLLKNK